MEISGVLWKEDQDQLIIGCAVEDFSVYQLVCQGRVVSQSLGNRVCHK